MSSDDEFAETQERAREHLWRHFVQSRLERAERAYNQALTSLWLGNAGAAVSVLSAIGAAWRQGATFPRQLLWPLWCFVLGLIAMGIGAVMALIWESRVIDAMLEANSVLSVRMDYIRSPAEEAGLSLRDWRTRMALLSAVLFVLGAVLGVVQLSISI